MKLFLKAFGLHVLYSLLLLTAFIFFYVDIYRIFLMSINEKAFITSPARAHSLSLHTLPYTFLHCTKAFALSFEAFTFTPYTNGRLLLSRYWLLISWMRPRVNCIVDPALCVRGCVYCGTWKSFPYSVCASLARFPFFALLYFCFVYFSVVLCLGMCVCVCV